MITTIGVICINLPTFFRINMSVENQMPASEETRKDLFDQLGLTIKVLTPVLKSQVQLTKILKSKIGNSYASIEKEKVLSILMSLGNYAQYLNLELISVLRSCFRAKHPTERRYNLKFINIVILEGYKHLYGYKRLIKKSLWYSVSTLSEIINEEEFINDYLTLDKKIKQFGNDAITNKEQRDLGVHYDLDPIHVYDMLKELDEEEEVQRVLQFVDLLDRILSFSIKYQSKYFSDVKFDLNNNKKKEFIYIDIDPFRKRNDEIYLMLEDHIEKQTVNLDYYRKLQDLPSSLKDEFHIHQIVELTKANMQLMFLYVDLASASRAFIGSELECEKLIALKQIIIIIYEGFKKVYDVDNTGVETYLSRYIQPIVENASDEKLHKQFIQLKEELDLFCFEAKGLETKRHMSVHYNKGVEQVFSKLYELNPFEEFANSLNFMNILGKVLNFSLECLDKINSDQKSFYEEKTSKTNESIDQILKILEEHSLSSPNSNVILLLKKIRSGEFFRESLEKFDN